MDLSDVKTPILVVSPPRCGSNLLSFYLVKKLKLNLISEPDLKTSSFERFKLLHRKIDNNFLLKIMSNRIQLYKFLNFDKFYKVRIRRKDIVAQCVSHYIATVSNQWIYFKDDKQHFEFQKIDNNLANSIIDQIRLINDVDNSLQLDVDLELYFEDIVDQLTHKTEVVQTPRPKNYQEIYDLFKNKIGP